MEEEPDQVTMILTHQPITFQRRIYRFGNQRELCYLSFLIEGQDAVNQHQSPIAASNRFRREPCLIHSIPFFVESVRASYISLMASFHKPPQTAQFLRCSTDLNELPGRSELILKSFVANNHLPHFGKNIG